MRVSCRLRAIRLGLGFSIRDLEAMTGIAGTDLSKVERGRLLPRDEWISALEQAYGAPRSTWYVPPAGTIVGVVIKTDASASEKRLCLPLREAGCKAGRKTASRRRRDTGRGLYVGLAPTTAPVSAPYWPLTQP
jgi:transcriptional regulator with XRE-family HTH domain